MPTPTPSHYKIICISIYTDDLKDLDDKIEILKAKGVRGVTASGRAARYGLVKLLRDRISSCSLTSEQSAAFARSILNSSRRRF